VEAADNPVEGRISPGERYARRYEINELRCIFCGYCEEACPTGAVVLREEHRFTSDQRGKFLLTKEDMLVDVDSPRNAALPHEFNPFTRPVRSAGSFDACARRLRVPQASRPLKPDEPEADEGGGVGGEW
jgi:ferredoxin